jgi:hypothetical protein
MTGDSTNFIFEYLPKTKSDSRHRSSVLKQNVLHGPRRKGVTVPDLLGYVFLCVYFNTSK